MNILGLFNGNCSGVCIISGKQIRYAALEERFTRVKFMRSFPIRAIEDGLQRCGLSTEDIAVVACGAWANPDIETIADFLNAARLINAERASERLYHSLRSDHEFKTEFIDKSRSLFPNASIQTFDHHYSHACTAFYPSSFDNAWVLTVDGRGDLQSAVIWYGDRKTGLRRIKTLSELRSLGALYGQITGYLGFVPDRHEGKVTGLAAHGAKTDLISKMEKMLVFDGETITPSDSFVPFLKPDNSNLKCICDGYSSEDIACAVQTVLEKSILGLILRYVPKGANLALAGGVFANVKLNQRIRESGHVSNMFIFPEMGDGGNSAGGAIAAAVDSGVDCFDFQHVYLGPEYKWSEADLHGLDVDYIAEHKAMAFRVVELLTAGKFIGFFSGRMEYGPRALGARSILFSPRDPEINNKANARLNRTEFMPFAPITLPELAHELFIGWSPEDINTNFMTTCYPCSERMKKFCPGAVHIDGTARPQVVDAENAPPLLVEIIKVYTQISGEPALINTSFNNHEEPIVCTPSDAVESLRKGNVDYIVSDGLLISLRV